MFSRLIFLFGFRILILIYSRGAAEAEFTSIATEPRIMKENSMGTDGKDFNSRILATLRQGPLLPLWTRTSLWLGLPCIIFQNFMPSLLQTDRLQQLLHFGNNRREMQNNKRVSESRELNWIPHPLVLPQSDGMDDEFGIMTVNYEREWYDSGGYFNV